MLPTACGWRNSANYSRKYWSERRLMDKGKQKLLIIEPLFRGHHVAYLQWIIREGLRLGHEINLATLKANRNHPLFPALREEFGPGLEILLLEDDAADEAGSSTIPRLIRRECRFYGLLRRTFRETYRTGQPDAVLLPYLDYCTHALALFGSPFGKTPWYGIIMRPAFHLARMGIQAPCQFPRLREALFSRLLRDRTLGMLYTIDQTLEQYMGETDPASAGRIRYLPDPGELSGSISRGAARRMLRIVADAHVILVYGEICARKGFDALLLAASEPSFPKNAHILLAGQQDQMAADFLNSPPGRELLAAGRLHQMNSFLTKDEEYRAFAASDTVWLGYRGHCHMSGVLVQAGQMGLPVIACREGLIGRLAETAQLGMTVSIDDKQEVAAAVQRLVRDVELANKFAANGRRFFASHTPELFAGSLFDAFQGR